MKKIAFLTLCLCAFLCHRAAAVHTNSWVQGHIHITLTDSIYHDSTNCTPKLMLRYQIIVDSSYVNDSIRFVDTATGALYLGPFANISGTSPWILNYTFNTWGSDDRSVPSTGGYFHSRSPLYKVTTPLDTLRYMSFNDSLWIVPCEYGTVSGSVYIDNNSNCVFDAGDVNLNAIPVEISDTVSTSVHVLNFNTTSYWSYITSVQKSWMTSYSVSMPSYYSFIFPMSSCFSGPYTFTTLPQTGVDFPLQCISNVDVQCYALSPDRVRLHTPFFLHPYVNNIGCDTVSGTMTLVKDSHVTYNASLSLFPADTVRGDTLIWRYSHLSNLSSGAYWNSFISNVHLTPDITVVVGDTLCFKVYTNIPAADINPTNNSYTICLPVRYSYDPNSKSVIPDGVDASGTFPAGTHALTYTINFQNTGTDDAYNVKIIDTLNSHLDPHSLKILGTSAKMTPKWLAPNIIEFDFTGIMLPDSNSNEPGSHGQVRFSIDLNAGIPPGTPINNTGYIYFDANPAVVTNTQHNVTSSPFALATVTTDGNLKIYPNPATEELVVENAGMGEVTVLNMNGVVQSRQHTTRDKTTIDISHLPPGIYMLKATDEQNSSVTKFTKY